MISTISQLSSSKFNKWNILLSEFLPIAFFEEKITKLPKVGKQREPLCWKIGKPGKNCKENRFQYSRCEITVHLQPDGSPSRTMMSVK